VGGDPPPVSAHSREPNSRLPPALATSAISSPSTLSQSAIGLRRFIPYRTRIGQRSFTPYRTRIGQRSFTPYRTRTSIGAPLVDQRRRPPGRARREQRVGTLTAEDGRRMSPHLAAADFYDEHVRVQGRILTQPGKAEQATLEINPPPPIEEQG
jgi:hypothetical protein